MQGPGAQRGMALDDHYRSETLGGRPILELAARLWARDRYDAFTVCYRAMRTVDDLVDDRRARGTPLSAGERRSIRGEIAHRMLERPSAELREVRDRFAIPSWAWERWTRSMLYDLDHDGFRSFLDYRRYAEGAAVAPGAIFMHLCGVRPVEGRYLPPLFDARRAASPLAIFCYLVHIVRDFESDQRANLHYFPDLVLARHNLTRGDLRRIAEGGTPPASFRRLLSEYCRMAGRYARSGRERLDEAAPRLEEPYRLSLEVVYGLYRQIYEKAEACRDTLSSEKVVPTGEEMRERIAGILGGGAVRTT